MLLRWGEPGIARHEASARWCPAAAGHGPGGIVLAGGVVPAEFLAGADGSAGVEPGGEPGQAAPDEGEVGIAGVVEEVVEVGMVGVVAEEFVGPDLHGPVAFPIDLLSREDEAPHLDDGFADGQVAGGVDAHPAAGRGAGVQGVGGCVGHGVAPAR